MLSRHNTLWHSPSYSHTQRLHSVCLCFSVSLASPCPHPPPSSSCFLASAPFLSPSVCERSSRSPALAWAEGSMSDRASYCNHWPVPQPPFGPWPPFPQLRAQSFISAEPGPRGRNDFSSLGLQPLSRLKLEKSWQILLALLSTVLTSHCWHHLAISRIYVTLYSSRKPDVALAFILYKASQCWNWWDVYDPHLTDQMPGVTEEFLPQRASSI